MGLLLLLTTAPAAHAHARFVAGTPAAGATITQAPAEILLRFSERIETSFGGVQVFGPDGQRVPSGEPRITGTEVRVAMEPVTAPGTYTVVFRIISGDSHPVESRLAFVFAPPAPSPNPAEPSPAAAPAPPPGSSSELPVPLDIALQDAGPGSTAGLWIARLLNYLALTAVVGLLLLAGLLLGNGDGLSQIQRRIVRLAGAASAIWALSAGALFVFGLSTAAARALPGVLGGELPAQFASTRLGGVAGAQGVLALAVAAICRLAARGGRRSLVLAALGVALVGAVAPGWWGHAGTAQLAPLALASDWAHVIAVTAWVGGLAALVGLVLRPGWTDDIAQPAKRFSRLAGIAVGVVLLTGTVNALMRIRAPSELFSTSWGRIVALKLLLFAGIAILGWRNRTRMLPTLSAEREGRRAFRRLAVAELGLMLAAFAAATALASSIPSDAEAAARVQSIATNFGDGQLNLTVDPATTGANLIHLYFFDAAARQLNVTAPSLSLTGPAGTLQPRLLDSGPGHYTVLNQRIDRPGRYLVRISASVEGQPATATGEIVVR
jgi:copper transport protein